MAMRVLPVLLLAGCAGQPVPDAVAPVVVTRTEVVEVPVAAARTPPPELLEPLRVEIPDVLDAGQGDYGMTRDSVQRYLRMLSAFRRHYGICRGFAAGDE